MKEYAAKMENKVCIKIICKKWTSSTDRPVGSTRTRQEWKHKKLPCYWKNNIFHLKLINKALEKSEREEYEFALLHNSKLQIYRELKQEIGLNSNYNN